MIKLAVYDANKQQEVFIITLMHDQSARAFNSAMAELRELANGHSIDGWINEYDLIFSGDHCVDKHSIDY